MTDLDNGVEPRKSNPAATVAVLAGLLACLPLTGLISLPAGAIGLRSAHKQNGFGRGGAAFGAVLGLINLLWWGALLAGAIQTKHMHERAAPVIEATRQFIILAANNDVAKAKTFCVDTFDEQHITDLAEQIGSLGVMQQPNVNYGGEVHSVTDIEVNAELKFDTTTRILNTRWTILNGQPKLNNFELRIPPSTQPTTKP